jgi:hypothetical protein
MIYENLDRPHSLHSVALTNKQLALEIRTIVYKIIDLDLLRGDQVFPLVRTLTAPPKDFFELTQNTLAAQIRQIHVGARTTQLPDVCSGIPPDEQDEQMVHLNRNALRPGMPDRTKLAWRNALTESDSNIGLIAFLVCVSTNLTHLSSHAIPSGSRSLNRGLNYTVHELLGLLSEGNNSSQPLGKVTHFDVTLNGHVRKLPKLPVLEELKVFETGSCSFLISGDPKPTLKRLRIVGTDILDMMFSLLEANDLPNLVDLEMIEDTVPIDLDSIKLAEFVDSLPQLQNLTWDFNCTLELQANGNTHPPDALLQHPGLASLIGLQKLRVHRDLLFPHRKRNVFPEIHQLIPSISLKTFVVSGFEELDMEGFVDTNPFTSASPDLVKIVIVFYFEQVLELNDSNGSAAQFREEWEGDLAEHQLTMEGWDKIFEVRVASVGDPHAYVEEKLI